MCLEAWPQTGLSKSTDDLGTLLEQARKPLNLRGPTGVVSPTRYRQCHFSIEDRDAKIARELTDVPAVQINHRQVQMSKRSLELMLDPSHHNLQVINDGLRVSTGVCNNQRCRGDRVRL